MSQKGTALATSVQFVTESVFTVGFGTAKGNMLSRQFVMETRETEVTAFFAACAALLMLAAVGLLLAWFHRIV